MISLSILAIACTVAQQQPSGVPPLSNANLVAPKVEGNFGAIPLRFAGEYSVILEPDKNEPEWWAGAPSVVRGNDGVFWMACRMRTADAPRGLRGYEIRILRSVDGSRFEKVRSILREEVPIAGFERPAILLDPKTGRYKLYICGPWQGEAWTILKFDDVDTPDAFQPTTAKAVIAAPEKSYDRDVTPTQFKDPVVVFAENAFHCYVIGYVRNTERIFHFRSADGERWEPAGNASTSVMQLNGWHDFFVRPSSVVPLGVGYLFVYEGSNTSWYDPVYNIATGIGFTFDLHTIQDLTPDSPLILSSTPSEHFSTFRYSHWLWVDDELWVYAEVARPNATNEVRLFKLKR